MTRDEIMALSGVSLRRAVAAEVMGYWVYHYTKGPQGYYMLLDDEDHPLESLERKTEEEAWGDCPWFEEDIEAAWQVVNTLLGRGCDVEMSGSNDEWCVAFEAARVAVAAHGATAAEAICRTALLLEEEMRG